MIRLIDEIKETDFFRLIDDRKHVWTIDRTGIGKHWIGDTLYFTIVNEIGMFRYIESCTNVEIREHLP